MLFRKLIITAIALLFSWSLWLTPVVASTTQNYDHDPKTPTIDRPVTLDSRGLFPEMRLDNYDFAPDHLMRPSIPSTPSQYTKEIIAKQTKAILEMSQTLDRINKRLEEVEKKLSDLPQ